VRKWKNTLKGEIRGGRKRRKPDAIQFCICLESEWVKKRGFCVNTLEIFQFNFLKCETTREKPEKKSQTTKGEKLSYITLLLE
jgi:hypothetical protein